MQSPKRMTSKQPDAPICPTTFHYLMTLASTRSAAILAALFAASATASAQVASAPKTSTLAASPQPAAPLPFDPAVTVGPLSNGMRYYIRENHKPEERADLRRV